jgi:hypothetical protein
MFELSWPGVHYCMNALRRPKRRDEARQAVAEAGNIQPSTAYKYLRIAQRLGLVVLDPEGRVSLVEQAKGPEELLEASALVRLFRARKRLPLPPVELFNATDNSFKPFQMGDPAVLSSAIALAKRLPEKGESLPPQAAVLLELTRLWTSAPTEKTQAPLLLSSAVAFETFERLAMAPTDVSSIKVEGFVRACMLLYSKRLVRLSIVQYAADANEPFALFRTSLGYIKWIHTPVPYRGSGDAEPVQAPRKLVSAG